MSTGKCRGPAAIIVCALIIGTSCNTSDLVREDSTQSSQAEVSGDQNQKQQSKESKRLNQFQKQRKKMVERQLKLRDISDQRVLKAVMDVARHEFVPEAYRDIAYADQPLPIGHEQTISQPYIVALMTQIAQVKPDANVLDVGTGSGYQAAILGELAEKVWSIEILEPLADEARDRLKRLGYDNITVRHGDGYAGWPEHAPFDVIIVAAAPDHVPPKLVEQLAVGGRLVIPVGDRGRQDLLLVEKKQDGTISRRTVVPVAFVPMTGEAQDK